MKRFLFSFLCLQLVVAAFLSAESDDTLYVRLQTEKPLIPVCVGKFDGSGASLASDYLESLRQVLVYDLNHNGMTCTAPAAPAISFDNPASSADWKKLNVYYAIALKESGKTLSARLYTVASGTLKNFDALLLTGDLAQDRREVHRLADAIHKALFGSEGIASTRILYTIKQRGADDKWLSDIWEADYDGMNARKVTVDSGYCVTPVYIPPRGANRTASFLFVSYQNGQPKIFYSSLKDGTKGRLTLMRGNQLTPAISWQRDQIAFISDVAGNPDLFVMPFSPEKGALEKPRQVFAAPHAVQGSPTFSPEGDRIAFVSNKDGSPRVYVMEIPPAGANIKTLRPMLVTKQSRESTAPCWSPDGTKLAYCAMTDKVRQIWVYDFETGEERQLTQGSASKENPSWAPNSLHLVYNTSSYNDCELYIIDLNQRKPEKISRGSGEKHYPSWEPLR